jgi:hypothetical protein
MEYIKLDPKTKYNYVDLTLYIQDVTILYNACVDILNEHPEMIGYQLTASKLKMILDEQNPNKKKGSVKIWDIEN